MCTEFRKACIAVMAMFVASSIAIGADEKPEWFDEFNLRPIDIDGIEFQAIALQPIIRVLSAYGTDSIKARTDQKKAQLSIVEAATMRHPLLKTSLGYDHNDLTQAVNGNVSVELSHVFDFGLKLSGKVDSRFGNLGMVSAGGLTGGPFRANMITSLSGSIPLDQDLGDVNVIGQKKAVINFDNSRLATKITLLQSIKNVGNVYWNSVELWERYAVVKEAIKLSERLVEENRLRAEAGLIATVELLVAESQLDSERLQLQQIMRSIAHIENELISSMGIPGLNYRFYPSDRPSMDDGKNIDIDDFIEYALDFSPEVNLAKNNLKTNTLDVELAENKDRFDIDLTASYKFSAYFPKSNANVQDPVFANEHGIMLTWNFPLFDYGTDAAIGKVKLSGIQGERQLKFQRDKVYYTSQNAKIDIELAQQQVTVATTNIKTAQALLDNELERQRQGLSTSYRVAQAQRELSKAKESRVAGLIAYEKAQLALMVISGEALEYFDVEDLLELEQ